MTDTTGLLKQHGIEYRETRKGAYTTTCPNCNGGYLNVKIKGGGAVWFCHACGEGGSGGGTKRSTKKDNLGPIKETYEYTDESGKRLFQVLRFEPVNSPKQFRQRTGPDQKKWSIAGVRRVLYRLPELLADVAAGRVVFICEGEKDVNTLRGLGVPATCNPMGVTTDDKQAKSAGWLTSYNEMLRGADVVLVADNDKQGHDHVRIVARCLAGYARRIRLLDLAKVWPDIEVSDDISDWCARGGGSVERLWQIVEQLPDWSPPGNGSTASTGDGAPTDDDATEPPDDDAELERLARLKPFDYERERAAAAKRLQVRAAMLDKMVAIQRAELGLEADVGQGRAVAFPVIEPWPDPVDGAALLDDIAQALRDHIVIDDHARDAVALWTVHSHLVNQCMISPRLCIKSATKGAGKTTTLDAVSRLVLRPLPAANITAASVFRVIERHQPTLLVDEADTLFGDGNNEELRGVLNSGHRRGGQVLRVVGDEHEPRAFATYGACAIALIGDLPGTLHDRSVVVDLKRRKPSEMITAFRLDRTKRFDTLARRIVRWAQDHAEAIGQRDPEIVGLHNRAADNWRPLITIADEAGGNWPERARKAALASLDMTADEASWLELLVGDIRDIFNGLAKDVDYISSADMIERLVEIVPRPWAEYGRSGKPITPNKLARLLKPLRIAPANVGPKAARVRGYTRQAFEEAFDRYLGQEGASEVHTRPQCDEMGTSELFKVHTEENGCALSKSKKPNNDGLVGGCALSKGGTEEVASFPSGNGLGLSSWTVKALARRYLDRAAETRVNGQVDEAGLRRWLSQVLGEEHHVRPEHLDVEVDRVLTEVWFA